MVYTKTLRPMSYEDDIAIYTVSGNVLTFVDLWEYNSDGISPSTYPIIQLTLGEETYNFEKEDIISATLVEESNPISVEIPISVLEFKIYTEDTSFSMFSTETQNLLVERFPVLLYEKTDEDQIFLGKFYLAEWKNVGEYTFEFSAQNIIGVMSETPFDGIYWDSAETLEDIFSELLLPIDVDYSLDSSLLASELSGWIPPGDYREVLQQICFAAGAYVTTSGSSLLLIKPINLPSGASWDLDIPDADKTNEQSTDLLHLVTGLEVISHDYSDSGVLEDIYEQYLEIGKYKIIFDKPYYDIVVSGPGYVEDIMATEDEVFEITTEDEVYTLEMGGEYNFGPNVLYLDLAAAGTVTITGYPWTDSRQGFTWLEDDIIEATNKNSYQVSESTLVNKSNAEDVLERLRDYYRLRYKQEMSVFYYLRIEPQDTIMSSTFSGINLVGLIQKVTIDLTRGFLQKIELIGIRQS